MARVARAGASYDGAAPLAPWISAIVKQSVRELLDEDVHEERAGYLVESEDERYADLARALGSEAGLMRARSIKFHALDISTRRTFYALAIERKRLERWVAEGNGPPALVLRQMKRALFALGMPPDLFDGARGAEAGE